MDGGDLPGFYPTRVIFFVYNRYGVGGMALADVFDARFGVVPFSAPRLRLVAELKLFCRCTAISPCSGNLFFTTGSSLRDSFFCGASPPTSPAQSGIETDSCLAALSSVVSGGLAALGV